MHLLCSLVIAVMALFPGSAGEGGLNLRAWMESYEKYLFEQMAENFAREEQQREQETSQEIQTEAPDTGSDHVDAPDQSIDGGNERVAESVEEYSGPGLPGTGTPVAAEAEMAEGNGQTPLFSVNGAVLDIGVQEYLYQRLCEANIGWFYQYAILIAYQESRFDFYAVNQKNHLDMGLFQYRSTFWNYGDIFNPYDQINVFTVQMMQRANVGCSVAEMISRHKTSDWGSYDQEYVNQVMQWESTLVRIR